MVFGPINVNGGRCLKWLEGKQNATLYCETIQELVIGHDKFNKSVNIFQQD